jgi:mannose-6-phosphate isomerase-like protein (cupin superfamily)
MNPCTASHSVDRTQRPWGWFETLSEVPGHKVKRIRVLPGQQISLQRHHQRAEHWVVVRGQAHISVGARSLELGVGQHVDIARGELHRLANRSQDPVDIVEVQFGPYLGEDDIERLGDDYGRT